MRNWLQTYKPVTRITGPNLNSPKTIEYVFRSSKMHISQESPCYYYLGFSPQFVALFLSKSLIISDQNVVEDCARFHLPQIESNGTEVGIVVKFLVFGIVGVVYFRMNPFALVVWVWDLLWLPFSLSTRKQGFCQDGLLVYWIMEDTIRG